MRAMLLSLLFPLALHAQVPDWAKAATVRVSNWNRGNSGDGGSGTICHYDPETGKAYVLTCRHVVPGSGLGPVQVTCANGLVKEAVYLGAGQADVSVLEIDGRGLSTYIPVSDTIQQDLPVVQVGWGGGHRQERSGKIAGVHLLRARNQQSYACSFPVISGDSGSGVFDPASKRLVGVVWGDIDRTTACSGPDDCATVLEACLKKRGRKPPSRCPGGSCPPGGPGGGAPVGPIPDPSVTPKQPGAQQQPAASSIDVKTLVAEITKEVNKATQQELGTIKEGMGKLTDVAGKLADKLGSLDQRLAAVEQVSRSGQTTTTAPPPASCVCKDNSAELDALRQDLAQLKKKFSASGTVHFTLDPKGSP